MGPSGRQAEVRPNQVYGNFWLRRQHQAAGAGRTDPVACMRPVGVGADAGRGAASGTAIRGI